ncbi:hypothetical protein KY362_00230 [Candidatus Woesearchaeota archaeon]|nr:hypothetical protein [Candidatus Woesearchaeota archaeon]
MKTFNYVLVAVMLLVLMVVFGCARQVQCAEPNVLIGNTCCLDADSNNLCDSWEEEDEEPVVIVPEEEYVPPAPEEDPVEDFAEVFVDTWNRKSYTALHSLFVKDVRMRFSSKEFNFLARKIDAQLGIVDISIVEVDDDSVKYSVLLEGGKKQTFVADVDEEDGEFMHDGFYFFDSMDAEGACGSDEACYVSFAVISGNRNHCDNAGALKPDCVAKFGVSKGITAKIDECMEITEYYGRAECLAQVAVKENSIEPCWEAGQDKQVFECMGEVAAMREDVDECDEFVASRGYPGTRLQTTYCILGYVRETMDTTACAKIDRRSDVVLGALQEGCYKLHFP